MPSIGEEMRAFWNGPVAERWIRLGRVLDEELAPFGRAAMDAAGVGKGDAVLDLGCGTGATLLELAARVGSEGRVLGADISAPMLAVARDRASAAGLAHVELLEADAGTFAFEPGALDVVISRFGWMFFEDPGQALANVRRALRPGGRAALVAWRALAENPWARVPLEAVARVVGAPKPPPPGAPGPFALADEARARSVMEAGGWQDVVLTRFDTTMNVGRTQSLDEAVAFALEIGPAARALIDAGANEDEALLGRARDSLREAFAAHHGPAGVMLDASAWVVTGRA